MLEWLKWKLASRELRELERWQRAWADHDRWLALTHPGIELVLRNLRQQAEGKHPLNITWPPSEHGPWDVSRLREVLKTRYGIGAVEDEGPAFDATQRCAWLPGGRPQDDCPRCHFTHGCDKGTAGVVVVHGQPAAPSDADGGPSP